MATVDLLVQRLKSPETRRAAFEDVVRKYSRPLYTQIRRLVNWHEDADDVLQNTFMKAWLSLDGFRGEANISTWLYRIAFNESLSHLAKQREMISLSDEEREETRTLESDPYFDGEEVRLMLEKALQTLPDKQRIVFNLKYFDEMKYEEMSKMLETSVGALKASYHLAVKKIETFFEENN